jgi:hypothetical protein
MTIFTLMYTGADTQDRIMQAKDAQVDARIAISYINVKIRQNDMQNPYEVLFFNEPTSKISVEEIPLTGRNAIVIRERDFFFAYDTWIYEHNGRLYELLLDPMVKPDESNHNLAFYITDVHRLDIGFDHETGDITNTVYYTYQDTIRSLTATIHLRSYQDTLWGWVY